MLLDIEVNYSYLVFVRQIPSQIVIHLANSGKRSLVIQSILCENNLYLFYNIYAPAATIKFFGVVVKN